MAEPGSRRALLLLAVTLVTAMSTWFSATAVIPQLRALWDVSPGVGAFLTIAVQIGFVVGALSSSIFNVSDVFPPARLIAIGSAGAALANAGLYVTGSVGPAIALRFATGFFIAAVYPPAFKLMATWFRRGRGVALGILSGAIALGSATPHLINGLGGLDWRVVVIATSLLTLAGGATALFAVTEGPFPFPQGVFDPRQAGRTFRNRGVRLASLGYFGHMWELFAMWAWFHVFFAEVAGSLRTAAYATFLVIGVGAIGCALGGVLGDRWNRPRTTALSMAASGTCALLIGALVGAPTWLVLVIGMVWGFTVIADSAQFSTMVTELADQAYVGTALTLQLAIGFALTVATIWLIPVVEASNGWWLAFALLAPGPALGIVAMLRLEKVT